MIYFIIVVIMLMALAVHIVLGKAYNEAEALKNDVRYQKWLEDESRRQGGDTEQ
jgi:hypothetical protein